MAFRNQEKQFERQWNEPVLLPGRSIGIRSAAGAGLHLGCKLARRQIPQNDCALGTDGDQRRHPCQSHQQWSCPGSGCPEGLQVRLARSCGNAQEICRDEIKEASWLRLKSLPIKMR